MYCDTGKDINASILFSESDMDMRLRELKEENYEKEPKIEEKVAQLYKKYTTNPLSNIRIRK